MKDKVKESGLLTDEEIQQASRTGGTYYEFGHNYECLPAYRSVSKAQDAKTASIVRTETINELWERPRTGNHLICKAKIAMKDAECQARVERIFKEIGNHLLFDGLRCAGDKNVPDWWQTLKEQELPECPKTN